MQESMMRFVGTALEDADIILYVTDVVETFDKNEQYIERLKGLDISVMVLINKIDLADELKVQELIGQWSGMLPKAEVIPISATENFNLERVFNEVLDNLPEGPPFYDKEALTDKPERFFISEIIREKILLHYKKEIPYSVEVEVEAFKEEEKIVRISALIYVIRNSQKGILIGHKGSALKKVGTKARIDIEKFLDKKVYLELFVKVKKDWRDNQSMLKQFGY
jgi:GTP-binding protein Era